MPPDIFEVGDGSEPYRYYYAPRSPVTGAPLVAHTAAEMVPTTAIVAGRVVENVMPIPAGPRVNGGRYRNDWTLIEFTIPAIPTINPDTFEEVAP